MIRREIVYSIISNLSEQTYTGGSKNEKAKTGEEVKMKRQKPGGSHFGLDQYYMR
jgi:hypothetical protein